MQSLIVRSTGDLSDLLARLHGAHERRGSWTRRSEASQEKLADLREAATELREAIAAACGAGAMVLLHSPRGRHHAHEVRTAGELFNVVVLRYSPSANAAACSHHCVLTETDRVDIVGPA